MSLERGLSRPAWTNERNRQCTHQAFGACGVVGAGAVLALPALVATAVGLTACDPLAAGPADPASAADAAPAKAAPKPTIVLVHGAWADASSWNGEVDHLQRDGYVVRAIDTPCVA